MLLLSPSSPAAPPSRPSPPLTNPLSLPSPTSPSTSLPSPSPSPSPSSSDDAHSPAALGRIWSADAPGSSGGGRSMARLRPIKSGSAVERDERNDGARGAASGGGAGAAAGGGEEGWDALDEVEVDVVRACDPERDVVRPTLPRTGLAPARAAAAARPTGGAPSRAAAPSPPLLPLTATCARGAPSPPPERAPSALGPSPAVPSGAGAMRGASCVVRADGLAGETRMAGTPVSASVSRGGLGRWSGSRAGRGSRDEEGAAGCAMAGGARCSARYAGVGGGGARGAAGRAGGCGRGMPRVELADGAMTPAREGASSSCSCAGWLGVQLQRRCAL